MMYRIDMDKNFERQDVKDAFQACKGHALGLLDYYNAMLRGVIITPEDMVSGKISDAKKEAIALCRQHIKLIPLSFTMNEIADDAQCRIITQELIKQISGEKASVLKLQKQMEEKRATILEASYIYEVVKRTKELHSKQMTYEFEQVKDKSKKEQKSYQKLIKENAYTDFFNDILKSIEACFDKDEFYSKYQGIVTYEFLNPRSKMNDTDKVVMRIKDVDFTSVSKRFTDKLDTYNDKRNHLAKILSTNSYLLNPVHRGEDVLQIRTTLNMHTKYIDKNCPVVTIGRNLKRLSFVKADMSYSEMLDQIYDVMNCQNDIMSSDNILCSSICSLETLEKIALNAIDLEKSFERIMSLLDNRKVSVNEEVVDGDSVEPQGPVLQCHLPADDGRPSTPPMTESQSLEDKIYSPEIKQYRDEVNHKIKDKQIKYDADHYLSQTREKTFNQNTLAYFFNTPTPHYELKQDDFDKFMEDLGATINKKAGNGSNVKITLNRDSVLIIPKEDVINNSMNYHMKHNSGHKEQCVSRYVIESAREFFKRAHIYEYLQKEYLKSQDPGNTANVAVKKSLKF